MHTIGTRANAILYYGAIVLLVCLAGNVITSYFFDKDIDVSLKLNRVERFRQEKGNDKAIIVFDLVTDLRPVWNWNTRLLFVYVAAEFETKQHVKNQVVLWDRIIQHKEDANLNVTGEYNEYFLQSLGAALTNNNITLTFSYNYVPITGILQFSSSNHHTFTMSNTYY